MNKKTLTIVAIVVVTALVAGGGVYFLTSKKDTASSGTGDSTNTQQSSKKLEGNALVQAVLDKVKTATPTVEHFYILTEDKDANNLIGKAGSYQYGGNFYDTRTGYKPTNDNLDPIDIKVANYKTDAGGSIKVFANGSDAKKWGDYLETFRGDTFLNFGEYKIVGSVVLQVSGDYKASQQQEMLTLMESAL